MSKKFRFERCARLAIAALLSLSVTFVACDDDDSPTEPTRGVLFRVQVGAETFRIRVNDAETVRLARENLQGRNNRHPNGPIREGAGGFNLPWTWHFDPDAVRMVEVSVEVCDGAPSYVETHKNDYLRSGYCPWGARIVAEE